MCSACPPGPAVEEPRGALSCPPRGWRPSVGALCLLSSLPLPLVVTFTRVSSYPCVGAPESNRFCRQITRRNGWKGRDVVGFYYVEISSKQRLLAG